MPRRSHSFKFQLKIGYLPPINENNSFGYEFYMLKSKEAIVIDSDLSNKKDKLEKKGIIVADTLPREFKGATPYMVISKEQIQKDISRPIRTLNRSLDIESIDDELLKAYLDWIKDIFIKDQNKKVRLIINLSGKQNENIPNAQIKNWNEISKAFNNIDSSFELYPIYDAKFEEEHFKNSDFILLYDMHGVLYKINDYKPFRNYFKPKNGCNYYEPLEKHPLKPILQNPPVYQPQKFILALIEAALAKIYVLDERINNHIVSMEANGYPERIQYERMNVFVPSEFNYSDPKVNDFEQYAYCLKS